MLRSSVYYFAALSAFAVAAFWPSYVTRVREVALPVHAHAAAMTLWCALLIAQAWLIRAGRRPLHRALGRTSYVLVPLLVASTLALARHMLRNARLPLHEEVLYFLYVQLSLLAVFVFSYAQAIRHRREPIVHASYMAGTALALVDPIGARLLYHAFATHPPLLQVLTYGVVDAILVALLLQERRRRPTVRVFPALLAAFVASQLPTFFVYRAPAWRAFAQAFGGL